MQLYRMAILSMLLAAVVSVSLAAESTEIDRIIADLHAGDTGNNEAASRALAKLPQIAPSDPRAQEAVIAYIKQEDLPLPIEARLLSGFDAPFAIRLVDELKKGNTNDRQVVFLLTIASMKEKAPKAAPPLAAFLPNVSDDHIAGCIRMVLIHFGYNNEKNVPWLAEQIERRSEQGAGAVLIASYLGLGSAAENKAVRRGLADWLSIVDDAEKHEAERAMVAIALAISGGGDPETAARVKKLFARAKADEDAGAMAMLYAYAMAWMDKDNARDYWRLILENLPENGRGGLVAFMWIAFSVPHSSTELIAGLRNEADAKVRKGAKVAMRLLRHYSPSQTPRKSLTESRQLP